MKSKPTRCSLCGMPNPQTGADIGEDHGYTLCCNEPTLEPGDEHGRGYSYSEAERNWNQYHHPKYDKKK